MGELEASSSQYVDAGALQLHVNVLGDGPTVVFLHGGGPGSSGWSDFGAVAVALADRFRCIVVDLPQYGRSDKPAIDGSAPSFHAVAVRSLLDALDVQRAAVVAQSIGGMAALRLALDHSGLVERLVLNGTQATSRGGLAAPPLKGRLGAQIWDEYYGGTGPSLDKMRDLLGTYEWFDSGLVPDAAVERRYRSSVDPEVIALAADLRQRGTPEDLLGELDGVAAQTLIVWGQHDVFGGMDVALLMANRLPDAELHVLPKTGHHPQEEAPARYLRVVETFLCSGPGANGWPR